MDGSAYRCQKSRSTNSNAFGPYSIAIQSFIIDGILNLFGIYPTKFAQARFAPQFDNPFQIDQAVPGSGSGEFRIPAPGPMAGMVHGTGSHHVEVDVDHAVLEVFITINHGAVKPVLPESTASPFAPIIESGEVSLQVLHHPADGSRHRSNDQQVHVV
jgi:hypothetical protein